MDSTGWVRGLDSSQAGNSEMQRQVYSLAVTGKSGLGAGGACVPAASTPTTEKQAISHRDTGHHATN